MFITIDNMSKYLSSLVLLLLFAQNMLAADPSNNKKDNGQNPDYSVSGEVHLMTHFVDRGLSMSDGNPAMNADFLFHFGQQLRLGIWGSNISSLNNERDNFWLKFVGEARVEFSKDTDMVIYFHDNHFYKSDGRDGQQLGVNYRYKLYKGKFEWSTNFEGSRANSFYLSGEVLFPYKTKMFYGGSIGYTSVRSSEFEDYIDLRGLGIYRFTDYFKADGALSFALDGNQFGKRSGFQFFLGMALMY